VNKFLWNKLQPVASDSEASQRGGHNVSRPRPEKTKIIMSRTQRTLLVAAAITGLMTGVAAKTYAQDSTNAPGTSAPSSDAGKHDCKGKNSCKGQGGCKGGSDNNSCKGQNSCKGKGGCKGV
jgi:hypothetical protein